jgi:hypothetical protein
MMGIAHHLPETGKQLYLWASSRPFAVCVIVMEANDRLV